MPRKSRPGLALAAALVCVALGFAAGAQAIGLPTRLVTLLTLYMSGLGSGVGLTRAVLAMRSPPDARET